MTMSTFLEFFVENGKRGWAGGPRGQTLAEDE